MTDYRFNLLSRAAALVLLLFVTATGDAATPNAATQAEIAHLLSYLGNSGCDFYRNGSWHDASEARDHLQKKLDYLANRSLVGSAEDFIARAATSSSISGEKYLVRCRPAPAVPSSDWLRAELKRFRAAK
jgi:hypothetical protein